MKCKSHLDVKIKCKCMLTTAAIKGHSATSLNFGTPKLYVGEAARPFISPCAWQQGLGINTKAATRA